MAKLTKAEAITRATYDRLATEWKDSHHTSFFWGDEMKRFNKLLPKGRLLEIGSGGGRDAQELIQYGYDYVGTDYSAGLIAQARQTVPRADFREVSVYDLDFHQEFDGFWCAAVLLHLPKNRIDEALTAINRTLKPGAIGFISTKGGEGEAIEARGGVTGYDRLIAYWQPPELSVQLEKNGFEVLWSGEKHHADNRWITFIVRKQA